MADQDLIIRDHYVKGLFLKEISPTNNGDSTERLLMVHGGSHGWWAFEPWMKFFARRGRRTFSLSLRNHTGSYKVPLDQYLRLKVRDYVDDLMDAASFLSSKPILIGHSMGGIIAQKAMETLSARALVLVASVGPGQLGKMRDPLPEDKPVKLSLEETRKSWFNHIDPKRLEELYRLMVPESPSVINEYSARGVSIDRSLITCPIFVIKGRMDRSSVHPAQDIAKFYAAEYEIIENSGHDIMLEENSTVAAGVVENWLGKSLGP
jgi:pimeloyl-ACP methyl ester carboxylesterase